MLPKTAIQFKTMIDNCEDGNEAAEKFLRRLMTSVWDTMPKETLIKMCRYLYSIENQAQNN